LAASNSTVCHTRPAVKFNTVWNTCPGEHCLDCRKVGVVAGISSAAGWKFEGVDTRREGIGQYLLRVKQHSTVANALSSGGSCQIATSAGDLEYILRKSASDSQCYRRNKVHNNQRSLLSDITEAVKDVGFPLCEVECISDADRAGSVAKSLFEEARSFRDAVQATSRRAVDSLRSGCNKKEDELTDESWGQRSDDACWYLLRECDYIFGDIRSKLHQSGHSGMVVTYHGDFGLFRDIARGLFPCDWGLSWADFPVELVELPPPTAGGRSSGLNTQLMAAAVETPKP
jgi:hypothetical protein